MTQDQHDPAAQAPGSTEDTSAASAGADSTAKAASSRPQRRRHTPNRSHQPKETQDAGEAKTTKAPRPAKSTQDTKSAPEAVAVAVVETPVATETAPAEAATASAAETTKRPTTRGRRGGGNRRRNGKADVPDIQLVPVTSATEPTELAGPAEVESSLETSLPAPELLPLDAAIFAHLDALSQAQANARQAAEEEAPSAPSAEEQPAGAEEATAPAQRRYRFDRQRGSATTEPAAVRPERLSGWRATPPTLMTSALTQAPATEESAPADEATAQVEPVVAAEAATPDESAIAAETPEAAATPDVIDAVVSEEPAEEPAGATEAAEAAAEEADQSEHESASRRRRRRGRRGHAQDAESGESDGDDQPSPSTSRLPAPYAAPETRVTYARDHEGNNGFQPAPEGFDESAYGPYTPAVRGRGSRSVTPSRSTAPSASSTPAARSTETPWDMSTAQRHVQESASPFGSPEPSFAHGFGPQSSGVASPLHEPLPRIRRGERSGDVPMSANQLGTIITSAITQQTDRLLSELRRQQYPPSMTVALPAFPSTERIGVFVDVANLLYSARSQRMNIDFGRLLDFLRANRRLIRAHAYAPTNPDPHAEQTFLSAVKGMGYRITTKNYKTFASGARKADMDLDLCMDIVRLVDADAIDTVLLVSGDSDFLPLLEYCSDHGVRVEVAAFDDAAAMILRQSCDLFINLSQVDEIRV